MTDYTDLIERLRGQGSLGIGTLLVEAADALEQLLAGREELVAALTDVLNHGGIGNVHQIAAALAKLGADKTGEV